MALARGTRLGPYQIESPIGAGGMGEVYKATDTRLERTVAIKVLPAHVASDPERKQRFEREAKVISGLNHPHICTLYEFDNHEGTDFLVMEYLEGETLADRLAKGALPQDQALKYAIEIADALDKAHRQGVTHRDLKPANIMLTKAGAKLLDFGLAKLKPTGPQSEASTKLANALTEQGTILGTFQYMAPEQLEGKDADARTDIWAFGCVVYEMVTGVKTFEGKSQASLIGAILKDEPRSISTLQPMSPPMLDQIIRICLAKDPDERWQGAGDIGRQLKLTIDGSGTQVGVATATASAARLLGWRRVIPLALAALVSGIIIGTAVWTLTQPDPPRLARFALLTAPDSLGVRTSGTTSGLAISHDGSRIVYAANVEGAGLYVRDVGQLKTVRLRGAEQGTTPFFSPDDNWVGFLSRQGLSKVSIDGGQRITIASAPTLHGADWGDDDMIVSGSAGFDEGGLYRVPAAGGELEVLTTLDDDESAHRWPEILPSGEAVLFTVVRSAGDMEIALLHLKSGERRLLLLRGSYPRYSPTGHIVYGADGVLMAVAFDLDRLEVIGNPVTVVEGVLMKASGASHFGFTTDGTLVYVAGSIGLPRSLVWVDRQGKQEPLALDAAAYSNARVSPDGERVALDIAGQDVWIYDITRDTLTQLTFDATSDRRPLWTPDGEAVIFASNREGPGLFRKAADGTGEVERIATTSASVWPFNISPDGTVVIFGETHRDTKDDLYTVDVDGRTPPEPLLITPDDEEHAVISPDGRWLAYTSDESGPEEIYVRPFPDVSGGKWRISTDGGREPQWGPNGRELLYRLGTTIMTARIETEPAFVNFSPQALVEASAQGFTHDLAPDGQRFLMLKESAPADDSTALNQLILVQNWFSELERLVPTP